MVLAGNKYKNTYRKGLVIITDIKTGIKEITGTKHKDTYERSRWGVSYVNPMDYLSLRELESPTWARKPRVVRKRPSEW